MKTVKATEMKNRFGQYLEASLVEPVVIEKTGRSVAVMLAIEEYLRLVAVEDAYWAEKALEAEKEGYLCPEESMAVLQPK